MKIKKGVTRIVLIVGGYAFKFPNYTYCQLHLLQGCVCNIMERTFSKQWKPRNNQPQDVGENFSDIVKIRYDKINPTLFCSWFGLMSIQKEVQPLQFDIKSRKDLQEYFKDVCDDFKTENFGTLDGKIVCIDYQ